VGAEVIREHPLKELGKLTPRVAAAVEKRAALADKKSRAEKMLETGSSITDACEATGLSKGTVSNIRKTIPGLPPLKRGRQPGAPLRKEKKTMPVEPWNEYPVANEEIAEAKPRNDVAFPVRSHYDGVIADLELKLTRIQMTLVTLRALRDGQ